MKEHYYLDNASTTWPKPEPVYRFMDAFFRSHGVNPGRAGHTLAIEAEQMIFETRRLLAQFFGFGGDPNRVVFTQNVTDSLNIALFGLVGEGDHVVTTRVEHNSVLRPLYHHRARPRGAGHAGRGGRRGLRGPRCGPRCASSAHPGRGRQPRLERARLGPGSRRDRCGRARGRCRLRCRYGTERGRAPHRHGRAGDRRPVLHRPQGPARADGDRGDDRRRGGGDPPRPGRRHRCRFDLDVPARDLSASPGSGHRLDSGHRGPERRAEMVRGSRPASSPAPLPTPITPRRAGMRSPTSSPWR